MVHCVWRIPFRKGITDDLHSLSADAIMYKRYFGQRKERRVLHEKTMDFWNFIDRTFCSLSNVSVLAQNIGRSSEDYDQ